MQDRIQHQTTRRQTLLTGICLALFSAPLLTFAAFTEIEGFVSTLIGFISQVLIPFVFALALIVFIWGMFLYFILGGGDEGKREKGKALIIWAIVGFVLMVTIWGIVNLFSMGLRSGLQQPTTTVRPAITPSTNMPEGVDPTP